MRTKLTIVIVMFLFSCQTEKDNTIKELKEIDGKQVQKVEMINGLSCPNWIIGVWQNTAESNTDNFITYAFSEDKLLIRKGLNFKSVEKYIESYNDHKLSEIQTDSSYLITLKKSNNSVELEFRLQTLEWSDTKVLTYSIIENDVLKRDHLKSVQLVLNKIL